MASSKIKKRLGKEIQVLLSDLPPGVLDVHIDEKDMHTIHFLTKGPPDTPFQGGQYVVKLMLPQGYPMDPPDFMMMTPNGRFAPGVKICTSFSSFHPETWSASYTLTTLILSFMSFMAEEKSNAQGVIFTSKQQKEAFAAQSVAWNIRHNYDKLLPRLREPPTAETAGAASAASASVAPQAAHPPAPIRAPAPAAPQAAQPSAGQIAANGKRALPAQATSAAPKRQRTATEGAASVRRALPEQPKDPVPQRQRAGTEGAAVAKESAGEVVDLALDVDEPPASGILAARREARRNAAAASLNVSMDVSRRAPAAAVNNFVDLVDLT